MTVKSGSNSARYQVDRNPKDYGSVSPAPNLQRIASSQSLGRRNRKPFHFKAPIHTRADGDPSSAGLAPNDEEQEATYFRFKYYQRLRRNQPQTDEVLLIPDHVVPQIFFYPYIPGTSQTSGKQNSLITIFAIWNTMMGTSLLAMPWAMERAGLIAGLSLIFVMAAICLYTAYRNLQVFSIYGEKENLDDFPDLCGFLLGKVGQIVAILFSALSLLGASIVYWVLMSNFLFNTVKYFHGFATDNSTHSFDRHGPLFLSNDNHSWNLICPDSQNDSSYHSEAVGESLFDRLWNLNLTVPIYLVVVLLPLMSLRSATFFTKFNALGTLSVFYIVAFVVIKASNWGLNVEFHDRDSPLFVPFVRPSFPALSGMLSLALFLHNCVVAIMKNNKHPEKNGRDLSIAYTMVALTYMIVGAVFYISFPLRKDCIEDNFLNNFSQFDIMTVAARIFLFFQMLTVFPLLAYILRSQILYAMFNSTYPGFVQVSVLNVLLTSVCVLFAIFLPQIGTIIRFSGALCGLVYIFTLPCILHVTSLRKQNDGRWPVWATIVHGLLIICGFLNLLAQFLVSD